MYQLSDAMYITVLGFIAGAGSLLKVAAVWSDGVLRRIAGWIRIPDDTSLGRIFKEVNAEQISLMEALQHRLRSALWKDALRAGTSKVAALREMWIDADSTVDTVFGHQEGAAKGYNPEKRGALSYHPIMAFCCETKEVLQAWLRAGNAYTSNGIIEFMKQLLAHLPNRTRIIFRGDSGFFAGSLLAMLESKGHGYLIKVKLKNLVALMGKQVWTPIPNQPGWEQCEFEHECSGWGKPRRFVAVRVEEEKQPSKQQELFDNKEYKYFCYVTTEPLCPWDAHKKYGERATCETWVEETKSQMGICHIRTGEFLANSALFQCAILAYNVMRWMALMSAIRLT
ncbi:MAG: Transposase DDE domain group 1 [Candidatus Kentron sp. G]|nr:MAG: Transposase DDE domain group 1 [Candidatus Kentron sp. G]